MFGLAKTRSQKVNPVEQRFHFEMVSCEKRLISHTKRKPHGDWISTQNEGKQLKCGSKVILT